MLPNIVRQKDWSDVQDACTKYAVLLPGTTEETEAEFQIWQLHWDKASIRQAKVGVNFILFKCRHFKYNVVQSCPQPFT